MSDEKLALVLFYIGFVLMLVSMVIGPFGITNWAVTTAAIACCLALGTIVIAFQGWDIPPEQPKDVPENKPQDQAEDDGRGGLNS